MKISIDDGVAAILVAPTIILLLLAINMTFVNRPSSTLLFICGIIGIIVIAIMLLVLLSYAMSIKWGKKSYE